MFVLIFASGAQVIISAVDAANLYRHDGDDWHPRGCMGERCQIDGPGYTLTAPTNWRALVGAK